MKKIGVLLWNSFSELFRFTPDIAIGMVTVFILLPAILNWIGVSWALEINPNRNVKELILPIALVQGFCMFVMVWLTVSIHRNVHSSIN